MKTRSTNPSVLSALWRAVKWLLTILLAGLLTLGSATFLLHGTGGGNRHPSPWFPDWVKLLTVPAVAFGLFVLLACAWVPAQKKRAGLLVLSLSLVFIGWGAYQHVTDDGLLATPYVVRYTGFAVGLVSGFALAHRVFKGPKWERPIPGGRGHHPNSPGTAS